jgi:hypothetical protein
VRASEELPQGGMFAGVAMALIKFDINEIEPDRSHKIVDRNLILPKIIHRSKFTWEQTLKGGDNT